MAPLLTDKRTDPEKRNTLRMPLSSWQKAEAIAESLGHSLNTFVTEAVRDFIARHEEGMTKEQKVRYEKVLAAITQRDATEAGEPEPPKPARGKGRRP